MPTGMAFWGFLTSSPRDSQGSGQGGDSEGPPQPRESGPHQCLPQCSAPWARVSWAPETPGGPLQHRPGGRYTQMVFLAFTSRFCQETDMFPLAGRFGGPGGAQTRPRQDDTLCEGLAPPG